MRVHNPEDWLREADEMLLEDQKKPRSMRVGPQAWVANNLDILEALHAKLGTWTRVAEFLWAKKHIGWNERPFESSALRSLITKVKKGGSEKVRARPEAESVLRSANPPAAVSPNLPSDEPSEPAAKGTPDTREGGIEQLFYNNRKSA